MRMGEREVGGPSHNYQNLEVTAAQRELSSLSIFTPSPEVRHKIRVAGLCTRYVGYTQLNAE
jgi:hypothetical protein